LVVFRPGEQADIHSSRGRRRMDEAYTRGLGEAVADAGDGGAVGSVAVGKGLA